MIRDTAVTFNPVEQTEVTLTQMMATRQADHGFWVAVDGDRVLGFVTYAQFRGGVGYRYAMEHTVIVAPDAAGRGVGRALMVHLEREAAARGAHVMMAGVSAENTQGQAFHAQLGYREMAVIPQVGHKFGRFMDLVLMQKILDHASVHLG